MIFIIPLFIPFLLLVESIFSLNFLLALVVFALFPIVSRIVGPLQPGKVITQGRWNVAVANISLYIYPVLSCLIISFVVIKLVLIDFSIPSSWFIVFSLWLVASLNLPVLHEMIHRDDIFTKSYCEVLFVVFVFPIFKEDHFVHHVREGHDGSSDFGNRGVSIYKFLLHRPILVLCNVWNLNQLVLCDIRFVRLYVALRFLLSCIFWVCVAILNCEMAFVLLFIIFLVHLSYSVISYVQHYGLSAIEGDWQFTSYSWSHDCLIQAALLFGNSLHHDHHGNKNKNFTELRLHSRSLIAPYSYLYLFFIAFFPVFFDRVMSRELSKYNKTATGLDGKRHYHC